MRKIMTSTPYAKDISSPYDCCIFSSGSSLWAFCTQSVEKYNNTRVMSFLLHLLQFLILLEWQIIMSMGGLFITHGRWSYKHTAPSICAGLSCTFMGRTYYLLLLFGCATGIVIKMYSRIYGRRKDWQQGIIICVPVAAGLGKIFQWRVVEGSEGRWGTGEEEKSYFRFYWNKMELCNGHWPLHN